MLLFILRILLPKFFHFKTNLSPSITFKLNHSFSISLASLCYSRKFFDISYFCSSSCFFELIPKSSLASSSLAAGRIFSIFSILIYSSFVSTLSTTISFSVTAASYFLRELRIVHFAWVLSVHRKQIFII